MQSTGTMDDIVALGKNRWMLALLADLASHRGARFVELLHRLSLPRDSLARTLDAAKQSGWVIPNRGHGHPLRPEYILTEEGMRLAVRAASILAAQDEIDLPPAALTRWSLPLVHAIGQGWNRFNPLARALPGATPRALSQGLRGLAGAALVTRDLVDDFPPVTRYGLTENGIRLARGLDS
jgi:DNA-binding HxlR family transcriptional regulator